MSKNSVKDILEVISEYGLSVEVYPNIVYVSRKFAPYMEEYVKLSSVGNCTKTAIELAVEKAVNTLNMGVSNVAA